MMRLGVGASCILPGLGEGRDLLAPERSALHDTTRGFHGEIRVVQHTLVKNPGAIPP